MAAPASGPASGPASAPAAAAPEEALQYRLSIAHVQPVHYDLWMRPHFDTRRFDGRVVIQLDVKQTVSSLTLNAIDLNISSTIIRHRGATIACTPSFNTVDETVTFQLGEPLVADVAADAASSTASSPARAELECVFDGELNDQMRGFYRSTCELSGETKHLAVTQFEATDARRAFPCWDEPAIKARFTMHITAPSSAYTVLSNMPERATESVAASSGEGGASGSARLVHFDTTPLMSTYLLTFLVGELEAIQATTSDGLVVRCFTPLGSSEQARFGLDVATRIMPFYNEFFGVPYDLPKLDMVAIPDFAAGAMEGWGLVTYRTTALLIDAARSSAATKQWVAKVVCHELAHQWFGNLVTMDWWEGLWLNEGWATWMENYATDRLFPEWDIWTQFVCNECADALQLDALESSHPVEVSIERAQDVDEIFDDISYSKGSAIIRMLQSWLGIDRFRAGVRLYFSRHMHGNTSTPDLWSALEDASQAPVRAMMQGWTRQVGFPVLKLSAPVVDAANKRVTLQVTQTRFLASGGAPAEASVWQVPLTFSARVNGGASSSSSHLLLKGDSVLREAHGEIVLELPAEVAQSGAAANALQWFKLNTEQIGVYRVLYPPSMLDSLIQAIRAGDSGLSAADRLGIVTDAFALSKAGLLSIKQFIELLEAYTDETEPAVWSELSADLRALGALLCHRSDLYSAFQRVAERLLSKVVARVGWDRAPNEPHTIALMRSSVIGCACKFEVPAVRDEALARFGRFLAATTATEDERAAILAPDVRLPVYELAVRRGDAATYERMLALYRESDLQEEKTRRLRALARTTDVALLQRTIELALSDAVRMQDSDMLICAVVANPAGTVPMSAYVCAQWERVSQRFGDSSSLVHVVRFIEYASSTEQIDELERFFTRTNVPGASRTIQQSLEHARSNVAWLARNVEELEQWWATASSSSV